MYRYSSVTEKNDKYKDATGSNFKVKKLNEVEELKFKIEELRNLRNIQKEEINVK
jgi:hypothetical protein